MIVKGSIFDNGIYHIPNNLSTEIFSDLFNNYKSEYISLE